MTNATLSTNNRLSINGRIAGQVLAVTDTGKIQNATAHSAQVGAQFRPMIAPATLGEPVLFNIPVYISSSPSDHTLNPALISAIQSWLVA